MKIRKSFGNGDKALSSTIAFVSLAVIFCVLGTILPSLTFDAALRKNHDFVVTASYNEEILPGDKILTVNDTAVQTRGALYWQMMRRHKDVDLTLSRKNVRFVRNLTPVSFSTGEIPLGLRQDDRIVSLLCEDGKQAELSEIDYADLKQIVEEKKRGSGLLVSFERPTEDRVVTVAVGKDNAKWLIFLILSSIFALPFIFRRRIKMRPPTSLLLWLTAICALPAMALLSYGEKLLSLPPIFALGIVGIVAFKALEFDLSRESGNNALHRGFRYILYIAPVLVAAQALCFGFALGPTMWSTRVEPANEIRLVALSIVSIYVYAFIHLIQIIVSFRSENRRNIADNFSAVALIFTVASAILAFRAGEISLMTSIALRSSVILLFVGDIVYLAKYYKIRRKEHKCPFLSSAQIIALLREAEKLLSLRDCRVSLVTERPYPKLTTEIFVDDDALNGLNIRPVEQVVSDFLDILRIEGGIIPQSPDKNNESILDMAKKLRILMALPVSEGAAASITSIYLVVRENKNIDDPEPTRDFFLSENQADDLDALVPAFADAAITLAYLSAEMMLEQDRRIPYTEAETKEENTKILPPNNSAPTETQIIEPSPNPLKSPPEQIHNLETLTQNIETPARSGELIEAEILTRQRSIIDTLVEQQFFDGNHEEIELSILQKHALDDLLALGTPLILIGERGVGKKLLASFAHQALNGSIFINGDARAFSPSVLSVKLFGDGDTPGLIRCACGGTLLLENVDVLDKNFMDEILQAIDRAQDEGVIRFFMTISENYTDAVSENSRSIAENVNADFLVLKPVRKSEDIQNIAEYFLHKSAIRHNKNIVAFSPRTLAEILDYDWPGNYDEMQSVIDRAVMLADNNENHLSSLFPRKDPPPEKSSNAEIDSFDGTYAEIEKRMLVHILDSCDNDFERCAKRLALSKTAFLNKLVKYGLAD